MWPSIQQLLFVGLGGFFGANARYVLSGWIAVRLSAILGWTLPYGTLFVNVVGSFLLAIFAVWLTKQSPWPENISLLVSVGFFGAFTTFSTYANESITLIRAGDWTVGIGNIIFTNALCLLGAIAGLWLANKL